MAGSDPPPRGGPDAPAPRRDANASQFFITTKSTTQAHAIPNPDPDPHPDPHPHPNPNQAMLTKIADLRGRRKVAFFIATNRLAALDAAVTRPGRFDLQVRARVRVRPAGQG